jgi:hypothetical protein
MTTAELVAEKAETLVQSGTGTDQAVAEILDLTGTKRVSVVVARQHFQERLEENAEDGVATRAVELLDATLERGEWTIE